MIKEQSINYSNKHKQIISVTKQISKVNNGVISTRMIKPLNISREYISLLKKNNEIEKVSRGI